MKADIVGLEIATTRASHALGIFQLCSFQPADKQSRKSQEQGRSLSNHNILWTHQALPKMADAKTKEK